MKFFLDFEQPTGPLCLLVHYGTHSQLLFASTAAVFPLLQLLAPNAQCCTSTWATIAFLNAVWHHLQLHCL